MIVEWGPDPLSLLCCALREGSTVILSVSLAMLYCRVITLDNRYALHPTLNFGEQGFCTSRGRLFREPSRRALFMKTSESIMVVLVFFRQLGADHYLATSVA